MQNRGAGRRRYSKKNSQYKAVARDRRKQKQPSKLEREVGRRLLRLTWKISTPPDCRLYGFQKENVDANVARLFGTDSIEYRTLRDFGAAREHRGCAKGTVERLRY